MPTTEPRVILGPLSLRLVNPDPEPVLSLTIGDTHRTLLNEKDAFSLCYGIVQIFEQMRGVNGVVCADTDTLTEQDSTHPEQDVDTDPERPVKAYQCRRCGHLFETHIFIAPECPQCSCVLVRDVKGGPSDVSTTL